jgi:Chaperone of endosialidase
MRTPCLGKSKDRPPLRRGLPPVQRIWIIRGFLLITLALAWFVLAPQARAVCQQGCDPSNDNTFLGDGALLNNTIGFGNTAIGFQSLYSNTTGGANTATGSGALELNTTGVNNTANGYGALHSNTTGNNNAANGLFALYFNTVGFQNTANGVSALHLNTTGHRNTANGHQALLSNRTGINNTADGSQALYHDTGSDNVGLGFNAGNNLTTGSGNVCIGSGVLGVAGESNTTRIKNVYASVASGRAVYVNSDNKIGTLVSSRRFKEEIKPMDEASDAVLALKPVTFRYKKKIEPNGSIMFGLIAEDVEKVDPDLVTRNEKGEAETVRYDAVNAMLLNEFLKEHRKVEEQSRKVEKQQTTISQLRSMVAKQEASAAKQEATIAKQQKQIEALTTGLQKVTVQLAAASPSGGGLELSKFATGQIRRGGPAPQVVKN